MADHKYTQESAGSGRVAAGTDFVDEINIINEARQVLEDLAIIVGQTKLGDGQYPADGTIGVTATNVVKNNFAAIALPTKDEDTGDGYSKGSIWIYNEEAYICVDATVAAAIWKGITNETEIS